MNTYHHRRISSLSSYESVVSIHTNVELEPLFDEVAVAASTPRRKMITSSSSSSSCPLAILATTSPEIKALSSMQDYFQLQKVNNNGSSYPYSLSSPSLPNLPFLDPIFQGSTSSRQSQQYGVCNLDFRSSASHGDDIETEGRNNAGEDDKQLHQDGKPSDKELKDTNNCIPSKQKTSSKVI